jgi:DNA polymerase III delta prime subunit
MNKLDYFLKTNKIPHIIFHGSSGTGKKTIVFQFVNKIYNHDKQKIKNNVMFVNCAHGKGIKFIREDIKFFAKTNIQTNSGIFFKTIILMNADFLTIDAQSALRRCIELFSYNTRFFIIVENKHKLLNPILSRFCEIYIPEFLETVNENKNNCKFINLHQLEMNKNIDLTNYNNNKIIHVYDEIKRIYELNNTIDENNFTINNYVNSCEKLYDLGISCLDIMNFIELNHYSFFNEKQIINSLMKFYQIKKEIRSEKLLILFMLQYVFSIK